MTVSQWVTENRLTEKIDPQRTAVAPRRMRPAAQALKAVIDSGRTGDKVAFIDLGAAPLGTDDEAAGTPDTAERVALAMRQELKIGSSIDAGSIARAPPRRRPRSPNIQIYRPQLTSVLSILNRITGIFLSAGAVGLVVWLVAAATGPHAYGVVQGAIASWVGRIALLAATFAFFLHLCGGIRHLVWDTVHGFELRTIYISGWLVVAAGTFFTAAAWLLSLFMKG